MLNPPPGFPEADLLALLRTGWGLAVTRASYRPVGFGSHHWTVLDGDSRRWFVTVDDLQARRDRPDEPPSSVRERLERALGAAWSLHEQGRRYLVAPVRGEGPFLVQPLGEAYAVSVYEHVEGDGFPWLPDGWKSRRLERGHRAAVLDIVKALHEETLPPSVVPDVEDFAVSQRAVLEEVLESGGTLPDSGPYAQRAGTLLAENAAMLRRVLIRYDKLADVGRDQRDRFALTHGEPHPGNTMRTGAGHVLIDWDTALTAPRERDLWHFGLGDPDLAALYRTRWPLTDVALATARFRGPHEESANDRTTWNALVGALADLGSAPA
jgi:spectinomycin phosphotransferase/16S rRNA (guanine(1405)-N(7))-methyltransferase